MSTVTGGLGDVSAKYEILEVLGSGAYGTVRKCQHRETGDLYAVKTILKENVDDIKVLKREINILAGMDHPNVIKLYDVYEDVDSIHLVTELCTGGELYDRVVEKAESDEGHFSEDDAAILIRDILDGIRYCHEVKKIVHRDLKPENFLFQHQGDDAPIKIIDFGLSRKDDADFGIMSSRVGTPYYVAPEVLAESYNYKCDIWSIGVIAYILLCGFAPFSGSSDMETLWLVETAQLGFPSPEWDEISDEAKDFIVQLLHRDAFMRPTAAEAMKHPWIAKFVVAPDMPKPRPFSEETSISASTSSGSLRMDSERKSAFQKFLLSLKLQKHLTSISESMSDTEVEKLGDVLKQVDQDKDGVITVEDIDAAVATGSFSSSLKSNLKEVRSTLANYPKLSINVKPFIKLIERATTLPSPKRQAAAKRES